jgi:TolA-binding protein
VRYSLPASHSINSLRFVILALLLIVPVVSASAQGVGSGRTLSATSGSNILQGRLYFPFEPKDGKRVRVRLTGTDFQEQSTVSDQDGAFTFNGLPNGHYTIIVEGSKEFDPVSEPLSFDREASSGGGRSRIVHINLKAKGAADAFARLPKEARQSYTKGMEAAAKGDNLKATDFFEQAVAAHPEFSEALTELGMAYLRLGKMEKAAQTYEALLKLKPNNPVAHLNLGIAYYNTGSTLLTEKKDDVGWDLLEKANLHVRESLKINNASPTAHYYLGLILIKARKYPEAQAEMEAAIANGGDGLALAHKYLGGLYLSAKRNKEAADHLEKYLQLDPKAKDADQVRGTIKDLRGKQ